MAMRSSSDNMCSSLVVFVWRWYTLVYAPESRPKRKTMLIHEAAAITELTIDAIRYYERQHLLDARHITRQPNGYRSFTPAAIERLQHLKHARTQGYTVAELRNLTRAYDAGKLGADERRA